MAKQQFNIRISNLTREQIDTVCHEFKMSEAEVVSLATERLFMQLFPDKNKTPDLTEVFEHKLAGKSSH